jgi:hypothetical protein
MNKQTKKPKTNKQKINNFKKEKHQIQQQS